MPGILKNLGSRAIKGAFFKRLEERQTAGWASLLASTFNSDQESESYNFLGDSPSMKEWIGPRIAQDLKDYDFTVKNRKFSAGIPVDEDDFRRDKTGQVLLRIRELAARAAQLPQKELSSLLNTVGLAYDGVAFYGTHTNENGDTVDNDISVAAATGTTPTNAEMETAILSAIEQMLGFKDDAGEPTNEFASSFAVMVPTLYWKQLVGAIRNDFTAAAQSNTLRSTQFMIQPIMNPRLTTVTQMYVFRTDADVKSLVWQDEVQTELAELGPGTDYHTLNDKRVYFAKRIGNGGYGRYQQSVRVTFT